MRKEQAKRVIAVGLSVSMGMVGILDDCNIGANKWKTVVCAATEAEKSSGVQEGAAQVNPVSAAAVQVASDTAIYPELVPDANLMVGNDIENSTFEVSGNFNYTGSMIGADVKVTYDGRQLTEGEDYILRYNNNIEVGQADVIITGIGMYSGVHTEHFLITEEIGNVQIAILANATYTGEKIMPTVVLSKDSKPLQLGRDYMISVKNNIDVGKGKVIIYGKGSYSGQVTKSFSIQRCQLSKAKKLALSAREVDGKCKVNLKLGMGEKTLKNKVDYKYEYRWNKKKKKVTVVVTGLGNYTGKRTFTCNL